MKITTILLILVAGLVSSQSQGFGAVGPSAARPSPQFDENDVAMKAHELLTQRCGICHGRGSPLFKGVNVDDYSVLVGPEKPVVPRNLNSKLLQLVKAGVMPQGGTRLTEEEIRILEDWVLAGAPSWESGRAAQSSKPLTEDEVVRLIERDLLQTPGRDVRFLRYFSVAHLQAAGKREEEVAQLREALGKILNSLSWRRSISLPRPLDPGATVFRIDLRDFDWDESTWNRILRAYPYGVLRPESREVQDLVGTPVPLIRGDWFVAAASVPPLYHEILGLPRTVADLERLLDLDTARNLQLEKFVMRAGVRNSGVSRHNRVLERHESSYGAYWKSYDFGSSSGPDNIFQNPLDLRPAGGEIIFSLPNGMQAYFLADARGNRIDRAPTNIVFDRNEPETPEVVNGRSCMSCHFAGMRTFRDDVRSVIHQQGGSTRRDRALALYVEQSQLDKFLEEDSARFSRTAGAAGGKIPDDPRAEAVGAASRRFEAPLELHLASAELGVEPSALRLRIENNSRLSALGFGQLLGENGTVKRDLWEEQFPVLVNTLGLGEASPAAFRAGTETPAGFRTAIEIPRIGGGRTSARTVAVMSRSVWIKATSLEEALAENAEFRQAGMEVVADQSRADLLITLDRPLFTWTWTYSVMERQTGVVIAAGKLSAIDGEEAARKLAVEITRRFSAPATALK